MYTFSALRVKTFEPFLGLMGFEGIDFKGFRVKVFDSDRRQALQTYGI